MLPCSSRFARATVGTTAAYLLSSSSCASTTFRLAAPFAAYPTTTTTTTTSAVYVARRTLYTMGAPTLPLRYRPSSSSSSTNHFRPFSPEDEAQLVSVLSTKPRHVARHIRQSMLQSRRRITQFRNSVTYLMILLQSKLQKKEIAPEDASALVESLMKECVELRQGDMAHLLFRAAIRFRKYGLVVGFPLVRHLYDSYRYDNAKELMRNMAEELRNDPSLKLLAVLAYQFCGEHATAAVLLQEIPRAALHTADYCALIESLGMTTKYGDVVRFTQDVVEAVAEAAVATANAPKSPESSTGGAVPASLPGVDMDQVLSSAVMAVRGDPQCLEDMLRYAKEHHAVLSEAAVGVVMRSRLQSAPLTCAADVYEVEQALRTELNVPTLGMAAETAVIGKCSELMTRGHAFGDDVMLQKVRHLQLVVNTAIENDQVEDIEPNYYLSLIKGFGVLGRFDDMRDSFQRLKEAGVVKDHRLYDEMMRWYAYAYNLKEVIALKEEMTQENVYHTPQTYQNVFRVLDKYYPRMVEKYLAEMRSKGMQIEGFMYPTLIRVFGELQDLATVENLYRESKAKAAQGALQAFPPTVVIQMLRVYHNDPDRCEGVLRDMEQFGFLANESVQAEVVHFFSVNDRYDALRAFLSRVPHKSHNMYRVLLRDASKRKDRRAFDALLEEIQSSGVAMNERMFSVIVTSLSLFRDPAGVRRYVHLALESDRIRTPLFFSDAAAAYARLGDVDAVDQCWSDLLASKMVITMPVYNRFLDLYMAANNMAKVQEILDTMMKLVPPNPVTATTVVDMLGKMGRLSEMEAVLEEMSRSTNAAPTLVTFHQAMNAYAKCGDVTKMEAIRAQLKQEGFKENHVTYNILFEGYGRGKRYEHLQDLREERKNKNIPMEEFGYVVLLNIYARAKMTNETEALVEEMVANGVNFSSRMLATVATSFSVVGNVEKMEHYVSLLLSHPDCRLRDVESVFLIYSRLRDVVKLQELLDTDKLPKSEFIYNVCVSAFAKAGEHTKVAYLLTQMEEKGYTLSRNTSVTLSSLLLKAGKLELAQTVLKWKGLQPEDINSAAAVADAVDSDALVAEEPVEVPASAHLDAEDEDEDVGSDLFHPQDEDPVVAEEQVRAERVRRAPPQRKCQMRR